MEDSFWSRDWIGERMVEGKWEGVGDGWVMVSRHWLFRICL